MLGDLSNKFPQEVLRNLVVKLKSVPLASWDLQLVELTRSLFQPMVQRSNNTVGHFFILWDLECIDVGEIADL